MYNAIIINTTPLNFINISEKCDIALRFLIADVNNPQITTIIHCPNANKNNKAIENIIFADNDAIAIIVSEQTGQVTYVEHGIMQRNIGKTELETLLKFNFA